MAGDRTKRTTEEVLFKWDDATDSKRRIPNMPLGSQPSAQPLAADPLSSQPTNIFQNVPPSRVLPQEGTYSGGERQGVKQLRETIKNIHLSHNRDWLAANNHVAALAKLDVLDKISNILLNRESMVKFESLHCLQRESRSEFDFNRMLYENRLRRLNTSMVPELCAQPVYIRNSTLISKMRNKCSCPLHVYIEWDIQQAALQAAQRKQRSPLGDGSSRMPPAASRPSLNAGDTDGFHTAREGSGQQFGSQMAASSVQSGNLPSSFGFSQSNEAAFGGLGTTMSATIGNETLRFGEASFGHMHMPGASPSGTGGNWSLSASGPMYNGNVTGQGVSQQLGNAQQSATGNVFEHLEAICPMHVATALPETFASSTERVDLIKDLDIIYRYKKTLINGETVHMLSLHKMTDETKVYHYRLPSTLQAINSVYVRDFELERYNALFNSDQATDKNVEDIKKAYLSSVYTGPALMIVTDSELTIAVMHKSSTNLNMGILSRERNPGIVILDLVCHKQAGRIFMLTDNSLLYEYQYQLGSVDVKDYSIFGACMAAIERGCGYIANMLKNERVIRLHGTVATGYNTEVDPFTGETKRKEYTVWWDGNGNCMDEFKRPCPMNGTLYWPPLLWRELHLSIQESSFTDDYNKDTCNCSNHTSCVKKRVRTCIKLLNPWCKSYFKMFAYGKSKMCLDQERWIISLLNEDSGDLSVFKIPDECNFNAFASGIMKYNQIFPYTLTFFSLRNSEILHQLNSAGYFRLIGGMHNFKCCSVLIAPFNMNNGVHIILIDNFGTRIYVGFVMQSRTKLNLVVKGYKVSQTLLDHRQQGQQSRPGNLQNLIRGPHMKVPMKPAPVKRSYFYANDLFLACEFYAKTETLTLCKVTIHRAEYASMCQSSSPIPQSVSEELWSHNQRMLANRDRADTNPNQTVAKPIEWFDEFCILMSPGEDVLQVYVDNSKKGADATIWEENETKILLVTSQRFYVLYLGSTFKLVEALLKNPISTLKYLDPPLITHNQRAALLDLRDSTFEKTHEQLQFVDIFHDDKKGDMCGEREKKEAIANGLYYLSWLYTPEEVFKACWRLLMVDNDNIMKEILLDNKDGVSLLITSLGIPSQLFGWTAPGAYALDDEGNPTTPIISPWCKFVVFKEQPMYRFNKISTNLTSPAIDGILSLVASILDSLWFDRTFLCIPLFTSVSCSHKLNSTLPFSPQNQLSRRNEFVIGKNFESDLTLSLAKPVEEIKATLVQLRKLYLLLLRVAQDYEVLPQKSVEHMAESISRIALHLQRDIFVEESHPEGIISAKSNMFDAKVVIKRMTQRRDNDFTMIKELATVLEIAQEYLACCLLLNRNCVYGDVEHEFSRMIEGVELLPSKSQGRYACSDLTYQPTMQVQEPVIHLFSMQHIHTNEKSKGLFYMSRQFFHIISKSNMFNLCSNQEFFRVFRIAVWLSGGEASNLQDYFYGHIFKPDELRIKHWSSMVKSLEKQLASAESDAAISHYSRLLMKFIDERQKLH